MTALLLVFLAAAPDAGTPQTLPELRRLAKQLEPEIASPWVKQWLVNVNELKPVTSSTWFCSKDKKTCAEKNPGDFTERTIDDDFVYARISDPLGYARAFELIAETGFTPAGKKVLDFGYGNLGQLLMLAPLGVEAHGVEIDPLLPIAGKKVSPKKGRVVLHHGYFASDEKLVKEVGGGYDLWISKNTLKRGYVHPAEPPDAKAQIDLGLDDPRFLSLVFSELKSGGLFVIYNIAAPKPGPYKPMADGQSPFSKDALVAAGFEVVSFDADDSPKAKAMAAKLEWATDWPDVQETLVATITIARRPKH